jgi:hypothetical protein
MLKETWKDTLTGDVSVNGIVPEPPGGSTTIGELFSPATICENPKPRDWFSSTFDSTGQTIGVMTGSVVAGLLLGKMIEPRFGKARRARAKMASKSAAETIAILVFFPLNIEPCLDLTLSLSS